VNFEGEYSIHAAGTHEWESRWDLACGEKFDFVRGSDLLLVRGILHDFVFANTRVNRAIVRSWHNKEKRKKK
jgi:hypothetical protein